MQFPSQFIGCKTSFYCFSWHLEQAKKYLFASVRRGEFENLENKIVLEIDYSKAKGNLGKLIVFSAAAQLQRKLSKPSKPQRLKNICCRELILKYFSTWSGSILLFYLVTESLRLHLNIQILTTNLLKNKLEISGKHQNY